MPRKWKGQKNDKKTKKIKSNKGYKKFSKRNKITKRRFNLSFIYSRWWVELGIEHVLLFGVPDDNKKDCCGSEAYNDNGALQQGIRKIKEVAPEMDVICDVCMCEYTSHGHCGILTEGGYVDNDKTLEHLAQIAVSHVKAGADMVAPSDMMDGRVKAIREALDKAGFVHIPIMSYSVKYASTFYGPFR